MISVGGGSVKRTTMETIGTKKGKELKENEKNEKGKAAENSEKKGGKLRLLLKI